MSPPKTTETGPLFATAQKAASENNKSVNFLASTDGVKPDEFWQYAATSTLSSNWNKLFPYQLLIMKRTDGKWAPDDKTRGRFTLPISPQSLSIDMPFAFQVEATQGGIIEQSNGSPFRDIVLQGNTGVLPLRSATAAPTKFSALSGIFAGTVSAVSTLTKSANQLAGTTPNNVNPDSEFESGGDMHEGTGYFQFLLLKRYLEWYSNAKKGPAGANLALGFAVWKENEIYLVTPSKFSVNRSGQSALTYNYTLAMRAWKRIVQSPGEAGTVPPVAFPGRDANTYAKVLNGIENARKVLENGRNVLQAVRSDANSLVFGNIRRVTLAAKDVIGTAFSVADFPASMASDFQKGILESQTLLDSLGPDVTAKTAELIKHFESLKQETQKNKTGSGDTETNKSALSNQKGSSPALRAVANPEDYYDFWSRIKIDTLNLRGDTIRRVDAERAAVNNFRREDYETIRNDIASVLADFEAAVGVGDPTYNAIYGSSNRKLVRSEPSDGDWDIIFNLGEIIRQMDALAASSSVNKQQNDTATDFIAGFAQRSGIAFTKPTSKFLVPFPYGYTLEQLSAKYLGSPDRWIEIASLNGLKSPYVDEVGFTQDFVTNGNGNKFSVIDAGRYYVGQPIWLSCLGVKREKRHISKIDVLSSTLAIITVDGLADLSKFTLAQEAFVQAFIPETVNSLQYIYIPSSEVTETDWLTKSIPGVDQFDPMYRIGGVDLLIDANGDLVITKDGTTRLAVGLTNLIQRVRIGVATPQGSLARHPNFGFGILSGTSTADISAKDVLQAAKSFIANESGFKSVTYAAVQKSGNGMIISMAVEVAGINKTVPISVQLK